MCCRYLQSSADAISTDRFPFTCPTCKGKPWHEQGHPGGSALLGFLRKRAWEPVYGSLLLKSCCCLFPVADSSLLCAGFRQSPPVFTGFHFQLRGGPQAGLKCNLKEKSTKTTPHSGAKLESPSILFVRYRSPSPVQKASMDAATNRMSQVSSIVQ